MGLKDRAKQAAEAAAQKAREAAENRKEANARQAASDAASHQARTQETQSAAAAALPAGAILQVKSHEEGRNSTVTLFPDRIERVKDRAFGSISKAKQDAEVIPTRSISSVQAKKDGLVYTKVTAYATGNSIDFRLRHDEAQRFKDALTNIVLAGGTPPPAATAPVPDLADQLTKLAGLRDQGILSEEEFAAQKAKLLG